MVVAESPPPSALDDIRVIDLSTTVAGAWCTRLLADFGADVIIVEPPEGSPLRRLEPLNENGASVLADYVHANKRSIVLEQDHTASRQILSRLLRNADIAVVSVPRDGLAAYRAGLEALEARWPRLMLVSITPHGAEGGREHLAGNDLTDYARSGWASINGLTAREPLKGSGVTASLLAGVAAYGAAVTALNVRDRDGRGQFVDVAEAEVLASAFAPIALRGQYQGEVPPRRERIDMTGGPVAVADGHFALTISRAHFWRDAMNLLGLEDLAADSRYDAGWYRQQHRDEFVGRVQEKMAQWNKMDLFDSLAALRVVAGPVLAMDELASNGHLREREYFARPQDGGVSTRGDAPDAAREYPGAPFKLSATPWSLRRRAPRPGEHSIRILREVAGYTEDAAGSLAEGGALGEGG